MSREKFAKFRYTFKKFYLLLLDLRYLYKTTLPKIAVENFEGSVVREKQNVNIADLIPYYVHTISSACIVY